MVVLFDFQRRLRKGMEGRRYVGKMDDDDIMCRDVVQV